MPSSENLHEASRYDYHPSDQQVARASGVEFTLHDLRQRFLTIAEILDIPHYALKRLANHRDSLDVTAGYILDDVERLRQPMQRITDFILEQVGDRVSLDRSAM